MADAKYRILYKYTSEENKVKQAFKHLLFPFELSPQNLGCYHSLNPMNTEYTLVYTLNAAYSLRQKCCRRGNNNLHSNEVFFLFCNAVSETRKEMVL